LGLLQRQIFRRPALKIRYRCGRIFWDHGDAPVRDRRARFALPKLDHFFRREINFTHRELLSRFVLVNALILAQLKPAHLFSYKVASFSSISSSSSFAIRALPKFI